MNKERTIKIPFDLPFEVGDLIEYDYVGAVNWGFTGIYLGMGEEEDNWQDHCKFFILKGKDPSSREKSPDKNPESYL